MGKLINTIKYGDKKTRAYILVFFVLVVIGGAAVLLGAFLAQLFVMIVGGAVLLGAFVIFAMTGFTSQKIDPSKSPTESEEEHSAATPEPQGELSDAISELVEEIPIAKMKTRTVNGPDGETLIIKDIYEEKAEEDRIEGLNPSKPETVKKKQSETKSKTGGAAEAINGSIAETIKGNAAETIKGTGIETQKGSVAVAKPDNAAGIRAGSATDVKNNEQLQPKSGATEQLQPKSGATEQLQSKVGATGQLQSKSGVSEAGKTVAGSTVQENTVPGKNPLGKTVPGKNPLGKTVSEKNPSGKTVSEKNQTERAVQGKNPSEETALGKNTAGKTAAKNADANSRPIVGDVKVAVQEEEPEEYHYRKPVQIREGNTRAAREERIQEVRKQKAIKKATEVLARAVSEDSDEDSDSLPEVSEPADEKLSSDEAESKKSKKRGRLFGRRAGDEEDTSGSIKTIVRNHKIPKDYIPIVIDSWASKAVSRTPAFTWRRGEQIMLLLFEETEREVSIPVMKFRNVTYDRAVEEKEINIYEELRTKMGAYATFEGVMPTFTTSSNRMGGASYTKNLYVLGGEIAVTPRSLRELRRRFNFKYNLFDSLNLRGEFSDYFKEAYEARILWTDTVISQKDYQDSLRTILQSMVDDDELGRLDFEDEVDEMIRHRLITDEYADFYKARKQERITKRRK